MKRLVFPLLILLAGCAPQRLPMPVAQCPDIGLNVMRPDFHHVYSKHDMDNFFLCTESQLRTEAYNTNVRRNAFERMMVGPEVANQQAEAQINTLEFQRNLWRQVLSGEKEPDAAYESWMQYMQNERVISAANASAQAARQAAAAANEASMWGWGWR